MMYKLPVRRVLVVDDQSENREKIKHLLESLQVEVEVVEACNGKEALDCFTQEQEERFDVITMDYLMPGMDGAEAVIEIRKLDRTVPIICISASILFMRPQVEHLPHMYYLDKPVITAKFMKILDLLRCNCTTT